MEDSDGLQHTTCIPGIAMSCRNSDKVLSLHAYSSVMSVVIDKTDKIRDEIVSETLLISKKVGVKMPATSDIKATIMEPILIPPLSFVFLVLAFDDAMVNGH